MVCSRAGVDLPGPTLASWVQRGRKQHLAGKPTALALFYGLWEVAYPAGYASMRESHRLVEIRKAGKVLTDRAKATSARSDS